MRYWEAHDRPPPASAPDALETPVRPASRRAARRRKTGTNLAPFSWKPTAVGSIACRLASKGDAAEFLLQRTRQRLVMLPPRCESVAPKKHDPESATPAFARPAAHPLFGDADRRPAAGAVPGAGVRRRPHLARRDRHHAGRRAQAARRHPQARAGRNRRRRPAQATRRRARYPVQGGCHRRRARTATGQRHDAPERAGHAAGRRQGSRRRGRATHAAGKEQPRAGRPDQAGAAAVGRRRPDG